VLLFLAIVAETVGKQYSDAAAGRMARRAATPSESQRSKYETEADSLLKVGVRFSFIGIVFAAVGFVSGLVSLRSPNRALAPIYLFLAYVVWYCVT